MKRHILHIITIVLITLCVQHVYAQNESDFTPDEVVYKGSRFSVSSSFVSVHYGYASTFNSPTGFPYNMYGIDFRLPYKEVKKKYNCFTGGLSSWGNTKNSRAYNIHLGLGKNKPNKNYNFFWSLGVAYTGGLLPTDSIGTYRVIKNPGIYAESELVYKIVYDFGIGASAIIHYDFDQPIYGIRLSLYLSNTYRGKSKNKKP